MFQNLTSDSFNVATNESMSSQYLYMIWLQSDIFEMFLLTEL